MSVRLITGEGGSGKTRLAIQLAEQVATELGWRCYWMADGIEELITAAIETIEVPVLVIVDYAGTRANLMALLRRPSPPFCTRIAAGAAQGSGGIS